VLPRSRTEMSTRSISWG